MTTDSDVGQIIRSIDLARRLSISQTTLWRWRKTKGFPQPIKLGPRMVGWRLSTIKCWLDIQGGGAK